MAPFTPTAMRVDSNPVDSANDYPPIDLLAGLWREAPFARLPADAPEEFHNLVTDIQDPRRVYAIHRASRRHDFQLLVEKYIHQLRYGCGNTGCTISTCFTCRRRLAGKAPIRRYNPSSARTLAVYLAGRDDPELGLCPVVRQPKEASRAMLNNLIFETTYVETTHSKPIQSSSPKLKPRSESTSPDRSKPPQRDHTFHITPMRDSSRSSGLNDSHRQKSSSPQSHTTYDAPQSTSKTYSIRERPPNKDHRSFAANVFGTVAFRMLEWLTPQGHAAIADKLDDRTVPTDDSTSDLFISNTTSPRTDLDADSNRTPKPAQLCSPERLAPSENLVSSPSRDPTKSKRASEATFRTPQSTKPRRRKSLEPPPAQTTIEEPRSPTKSPRPNDLHAEKLSRSLKSTPKSVTRGIPEIPSKPSFFENVPIPKLQLTTNRKERSLEALWDDVPEPPVVKTIIPEPESSDGGDKSVTFENPKDQEEFTEEIECPLPQTLTRLNANIVTFICDTFDEDRASEAQIQDEFMSTETLPKPTVEQTKLVRRQRQRDHISRKQWQAFNEQTLFSVLSDPRSLLRSFSPKGKLMDSHTLWYCMIRLTRTAPSLVFHSLWLAAGCLFTRPKAIRQGGFGSGSRKEVKFLSAQEAGCLMSICFHALVASVPVCLDDTSLGEFSRVHAEGLTISSCLSSLSHPAWLLDGFDDAFSNDLAVRLARRLCCGIQAQRQFSALAGKTSVAPIQPQEDIMQPFIDQIRHIATEENSLVDSAPNESQRHEDRMLTLVLDWARTVIFKDWDGKPHFMTNSPLAGALSVIDSLYKCRELLPIPESRFQADYICDRLEVMDAPIQWLEFKSTPSRKHLLDYPYLFEEDTLVSFFRSINFSRMSRAFEESNSLRTRMNAIVDPGSLITNPHHKKVLQEMLKTASSKYLILEIRRHNVLLDAFNQLWRREERELLRPLKVHLGEEGGEEGFDSGGVQQEFFRLAMAEIFDPNHAAFTVDERTRMAWFTPGSLVEKWKFELIGLLMSLAVYNGLTLPVTFPKALYRKLLGKPVDKLQHIADGWPVLASGLETLLEWNEDNGAVEDVFARTYEFSVETNGVHVTRQMTCNPTPWPQTVDDTVGKEQEEAPLVTKSNRDKYVADYIQYLTCHTVAPQFKAFADGFYALLPRKSLSLLSPNILQSMVEGCQTINIPDLKHYTRYVGWDPSHRTVRDFWSIVKKYSDDQKRKLLEFVTASDRLPVGGERNLQFVLQRNGEADGEAPRLPTAYTCYGTLLLPEYKDKEMLRERLAMALENAQGFGFA